MTMMEKMMNAMMDCMSPDEKQDTMLKMMPAMMKKIKGPEVVKILRQMLSKMMFVTHKSRFGFAETIQKIKSSGLEYGWFNPIINNHYEIECDLGLKDPNKVATVSMCIPRSAYDILKENKKLAVMMPLQINVYEEEDQVFVVWMNIEVMGKMFGPVTAEVMKTASKMLMDVHREIIEEGNEKE